MCPATFLSYPVVPSLFNVDIDTGYPTDTGHLATYHKNETAITLCGKIREFKTVPFFHGFPPGYEFEVDTVIASEHITCK